MDEGADRVIPLESERHVDHRRMAHGRVRTIRTVFENPSDGYSAVSQLRARGFTIDITASIAGDLIVSIQVRQTHDDQIAALVAAQHGRIEGSPGRSGRFNRSPWIVENRRPDGSPLVTTFANSHHRGEQGGV